MARAAFAKCGGSRPTVRKKPKISIVFSPTASGRRKTRKQNRRTAAMLTLPIKRQWYDMILCGQKREEYREDNPYYRSRFEKLFDLSPEALADPVRQKASTLRLRNGYNTDADTMEITAVLQHGEGRPEWGAEPGKPCFILRILSVKSV
jgi:hypothetical protein